MRYKIKKLLILNGNPRTDNESNTYQNIIHEMEDATDVLLGSPVYLDMPTPQTVSSRSTREYICKWDDEKNRF